MLPLRPQLQGVRLPGTAGMVASGLGNGVQVKEVHEDGTSLCTTENDKEERDRVFADTPQRRDLDPCGAGKEGQLETTLEEHCRESPAVGGAGDCWCWRKAPSKPQIDSYRAVALGQLWGRLEEGRWALQICKGENDR